MDIKTTIACTCRVSAALEESGELAVKVFAQAAYAKGRTTTIDVTNIPEALKAKVKAVLAEVLETAKPEIGPRIHLAIVKSAEIGAAMGEV